MTMQSIRVLAGDTFASLAVRNYRLYYIGQGLSHCGNWMQTVAAGWLVLTLTGSGIQLGAVMALRYLPMLLGGFFAGEIVDRFDKRTLLFRTQSVAAALALFLSAVVFFDVVQLWMLYIVALLSGITDAIDNPTRQTFVHEMVGPENLRNAVTLNSTMANLARALGPMFAGTLIATVGIAFCFFANALSFLAVIAALRLIRSGELHSQELRPQAGRDYFAGMRYAASKPVIKSVLLAMAVIGTLSYEFQVSLPLLARSVFAGGAADYAALLSAMGVGSVVGGLYAASRKRIAFPEFVMWALLFGLSICITAFLPSLSLATVGMVAVGFFSINLTSTGNTMIQLESDAHMRGRVMALWSSAIFGSTLVGAPVIGAVGEYAGARWALAIGGVAALAAGLAAGRRLLKLDRLLIIPAFIQLRRQEQQLGETKG